MREAQDSPDFESWVRASGAGLLRFAYLVLRDHDRAEEAVQDALVAACPRWKRIVRSGDPGPYLRRCVINADVSRWRRFGRRETPFADLAELADSAIDDPADSVVDDDALWELCGTLPLKQHAAVVLRYYEGRTDAEIAEALGCTVSTVRSQIHRALATLRGRIRVDLEVEQA